MNIKRFLIIYLILASITASFFVLNLKKVKVDEEYYENLKIFRDNWTLMYGYHDYFTSTAYVQIRDEYQYKIYPYFSAKINISNFDANCTFRLDIKLFINNVMAYAEIYEIVLDKPPVTTTMLHSPLFYEHMDWSKIKLYLLNYVTVTVDVFLFINKPGSSKSFISFELGPLIIKIVKYKYEPYLGSNFRDYFLFIDMLTMAFLINYTISKIRREI